MRDFRIDIPQAVLDDLQLRLAGVRWPPPLEGVGWDRGTDADYLRHLIEYWRERYDWRAHEAELNDLDHRVLDLDSDTVDGPFGMHAIVQPSEVPDAPALLLLHGWPDSFLRFRKVLPLLTDFQVVVPSLPGYGFSDRPVRPGMTRVEMADLMAQLMTGLGHERFIVSGGDIGTGVVDRLARRHPSRLIGLHLTDLPFRKLLAIDESEWTDAEHGFVRRGQAWSQSEGGYQHLQSTKPATAAYGLTDSPAGLAAWIVEKLRSWSDCDGDISTRFTPDEVITFLMVYWVTDTIASSFGPYFERDDLELVADRIDVPAAVSVLPADLVRPVRDLGERLFNLRRWTEFPRGGHFAAFEEPELFADELRAFAAELSPR